MAKTPSTTTKRRRSPAVPTAVRQLREQVETKRLRLEQTRLDQQLRLSESVTDSIYGTPVPLEQIYAFRGQSITPIWFRDPYQAKGTTLRLVIDYDRSRNLARYAYETNPNAQAVINGLAAYVVASGYDVVVTPKKRRGKQEASVAGEEADPAAAESEKAQAIIDEFVEVNELKEAADGCPFYDEAFHRAHVDGECLVRLFPDDEGIEPTRCRFVEPDNIRPPMAENWEGPWSFGVLTSGDPASSDYGQNLAWDTQTVRAYNVNYPLVNRDELVLPQFMFHLKSNVKKNQKRGISSLYSTDEDLRGTQKLRYAAREGAKIRASIPYVREHQQADLAALQSLQESLITSTVTRTDQWANQYDVNVQQVEPGSVVDIPESLKMQNPPADPNADAVERNLKHGVETIAARFNAPAWLVGGASNESSYASSLTSESPFLRVVLKQQAKQTGYWKAIFKAVLEIAIEQGRLAEGALERLNIVVKAQNPQARNKKEEADTNKILHDEGVISLQSWTADAGYDFDEEQAERREEEASGVVPEKILPPGLGGPNGENGQQPPGKQPETISGQRQREEGVREQAGYAEAAVAGYAIGLSEAAMQETWDEGKHPRGQPENAGEFAAGGGGGKIATMKSSNESRWAGLSNKQRESAMRNEARKEVADIVTSLQKEMGNDWKKHGMGAAARPLDEIRTDLSRLHSFVPGRPDEKTTPKHAFVYATKLQSAISNSYEYQSIENALRNELHEAHERESSVVRSDVRSKLEAMGFALERDDGGGSIYLHNADKDLTVRISNHHVPLTDEREHNATTGGMSWADSPYSLVVARGSDEEKEMATEFVKRIEGETIPG